MAFINGPCWIRMSLGWIWSFIVFSVHFIGFLLFAALPLYCCQIHKEWTPAINRTFFLSSFIFFFFFFTDIAPQNLHRLSCEPPRFLLSLKFLLQIVRYKNAAVCTATSTCHYYALVILLWHHQKENPAILGDTVATTLLLFLPVL